MKAIKELSEEQKQKALTLIKEGQMNRKDISKAIHTRYCNLKAFLDQQNIPIKEQGIPSCYHNDIFKLYNKGMTCKEIHKQFYSQFTIDQINYICQKKGITRRTGKRVQLCHNYFEKIDTERKAYFLGLLFADGNVQNEKGNSWSIGLSLMKEDKYLVEEFAKEIKTDLSVKEYLNNTGFQRKDGEPHIECRLVVHSKKMADDLGRYGIVPRKSLIVSTIPTISKELLPHFIRGFMDGNGCITYNYSHNIKNIRVLFYSTNAFCSSLKELLEKEDIICSSIYNQKEYKVSFFSCNRKESIKKLYDYLYSDSTIYMKRKKKKIDEFISKYRDNYSK